MLRRRSLLEIYLLLRLAQWWPHRWVNAARVAVQSRTASKAAPGSDGRPRQLLVDVSIIARNDAGSGIQRVVRALLLCVLQSPPDGFIVRPVQATRKQGYRYADNYLVKLSGQPRSDSSDSEVVQVAAGDVFLGLDLTSRILPRRQSELLRWRQQGVKLVVVVYDLLPVLHPDWFTPIARKAFPRWLATLAVHADALFCISASVAKQADDWLRRQYSMQPAALPTRWFHLGADLVASQLPSNQGESPRYAQFEEGSGPVILMVGTIEPRKGHAQVLDALDILWEQGGNVKLVIVGKPGWHMEAMAARLRQHPEAGKRLIWLERAGDAELSHLYCRSNGLVMASEAEGFGLPLVEAAQHGIPLLVRDIEVFREIAGAHASYFAAGTGAELAPVLARWLDQLQAGSAPDSRSMPWLTWSESAMQLKKLLATLPW